MSCSTARMILANDALDAARARADQTNQLVYLINRAGIYEISDYKPRGAASYTVIVPHTIWQVMRYFPTIIIDC